MCSALKICYIFIVNAARIQEKLLFGPQKRAALGAASPASGSLKKILTTAFRKQEDMSRDVLRAIQCHLKNKRKYRAVSLHYSSILSLL